MRRTKIIATLGPATNNPETMAQLIEAGVDVVRINFSHGDWTDHKAQISMVRDISRNLGRHVGILGDLQGPKIRINRFREGAITLVDGQTFVLDTAMDPDGGTENAVGVAYEDLVDDVSSGDVLLLDDGQIVLQVDAVGGTQISCTVTAGGVLADTADYPRCQLGTAEIVYCCHWPSIFSAISAISLNSSSVFSASSGFIFSIA